MGVPLEGDNVMNKDQVIQLIDNILNEMEEGEPNDLKNEPSQDPEEELERVEDDLGGAEGEELEDYEAGEDYDEGDDEDLEELVHMMVDATLLEQDSAYQAYFRSVMKKHNIDGIRGLSPEKRSEFFKDVSRGWKKGGNVKESLEQDLYEDYKKYFNYLAEKCGIDDMSLLEDEEVAEFYALVHEAYEVGTGLVELMQAPGQGYDKGIVQGYGRPADKLQRRMRKAQTGAAMMNPNTSGKDLRTFTVRGQTKQLTKRI
jgi:hypothetical protein